ncbi:MAG: YkgJ family cysteine cluster protein [Caulobacteraceae bacterium]
MAEDASETATPILLRATPPAGEAVLEGDFSLAIAGEAVSFHVEAPEGPTTLEALMPVFQGLSNELARRAAARAVSSGKAITCRAGCGACCRQAVPVAEAEARRLAALVEAMPEPRRSEIRARFEAAERRLEETALASRLVDMPDGKTVIDVGTKYFGLGVPCPFLEAESCSIHPDRPLRCREYFVTSPAAACAAMVPGTIDMTPLAGVPSKALYAVGAEHTPEGWLLLTQALSFTERYPQPSAARPAPDWIGAVVGRLAQQ